MAFKRVAGTCFLKRDGVQYALRGQLTINPASVLREGLAGLDGVHGYKESPRVPFIEATLTKGPELSLREVEGVTNATITAECADGTVYVLSEAWQAGELALDAAEGQVTVRFEGASCREITA